MAASDWFGRKVLRRVLGVLFCLVQSVAGAAELPLVRAVTSEFPPYNFTYNGDLTGVSVAVVRALLAEAGMGDVAIENMPWARAYQVAKASPNILIFSITRTPDRETMFKWIGTIAPVDYSFFAPKKSGLNLARAEDARQLRVATTTGDVVDQLFKRLEFPHVQTVGGQTAYDQNVRKLLAGRVDVWGVATLPAIHFLESADLRGEIVRVGAIRELDSEGMYVAFGSQTADKVVVHFRRALERVKQRGVDREALQRFLSSP